MKGGGTKRTRCLIYLYDSLSVHFRDEPGVFIALDLPWFPERGDEKTYIVPSLMVVFGRPKGDRDCYRQWEEGDIPPQVVFDVSAPQASFQEMLDRFRFYERFGVEEFYLFEADAGRLEGWRREENCLVPIERMEEWVSPHLKVKFLVEEGTLVLYGINGKRLLSYEELWDRYEELQGYRRELERRLQEEQDKVEKERRRADRVTQRLREFLREIGIEVGEQ